MAQAPAFCPDFLARLVTEPHRHKLHEFEMREQPVVIVPVDDYVVIRGKKLLPDKRRWFVSQVPAVFSQEI